MVESILFRGSSIESEKAKKILNESKIEFGEIYSSSHSTPLLIVMGHAYSYKGLSSIKDYALDYGRRKAG
jgi:hypothetical protein